MQMIRIVFTILLTTLAVLNIALAQSPSAITITHDGECLTTDDGRKLYIYTPQAFGIAPQIDTATVKWSAHLRLLLKYWEPLLIDNNGSYILSNTLESKDLFFEIHARNANAKHVWYGKDDEFTWGLYTYRFDTLEIDLDLYFGNLFICAPVNKDDLPDASDKAKESYEAMLLGDPGAGPNYAGGP